MAQTIKLKRSATQGAIPSTSSLDLGEVAINTYDGKMYIKKDDGTPAVVEIGEVTQADVTAHEAALSITKSQVTDLATSDLDLGTNKILYSNVYSTLGDLPDASSYHGMFAHVHGTGKAYYAHAGSWVELANVSELFDGAYSSLTGTPTNVSSFTNDAGYLTAETTTTLTSDSVNQKLVFTDETGTPNDVDLSWIDDLKVLSTKTLDNPNAYSTSADDNFGNSVAISGNYAIVGAHLEDDAGGSGSGKAYILDSTTGALVHTLDNPNAYSTSAADLFGYSVAISGNYAIVGAYLEDDGFGTSSGKAYIFDVTTGALHRTLSSGNLGSAVADDRFGYSVAISGNYAIVGAYNEEDAGANGSGKAYIFNATTGALLHTLDNPNAYGTSASDLFGRSVAISGNYAIVGAFQEDDASASNSGKAYIFNVTTGALLHTLDNPSVGSSAFFGQSVAISGNYAIVGAHFENDAGGNGSGKAYIFNVTTGGLLHTLDNPNAYGASSFDQFGYSVAISGNYAIVGAYEEDDAGGNGSGKAYIFSVVDGSLVATLDNPNAYSTSDGDEFGQSVAISGNYAIVGVPNEDDAGGSSSGKAYIFKTNTQPYSYTGDEIASFAPASSGGGVALTDFSVTQNAASGNGTLSYNNTSGVFTYTPPNLSSYLTSVAFGDLTSTPTTLAGYGITDAFDGAYSSLTGAPTNVSSFTNDAGYLTSVAFGDLTSTPTTLAGYGITDAFDGAYSSLTGAPTTVSSFTNDSGYLTSETTTTLTGDSVNQKLVFTDETGTPNDIDLSWTVDDTNLARITSGSVNGSTGIATFTRDDATTFTVDFSSLFDDTNLTRITSGSVSGSTLTLTRSDATTVSVDVSSLLDNTDTIDYINAASFNAGTGVLSLTGIGNAGATVDLDGRYLTSVAFSDLTSTPTTLAGYGITDAFDGDYSSLSNSPTSILNFGITDGTAGQVLQTDGSGNFSFTSVSSSSGGISNIVEDTTPQLGGTLDANNNDITNIGADGYSLPTADGTSGQVLTTDGAGTLSFTTPASGGTDVYLVDGGSATAIYTNGDLILDGGNA